MFIRHDLMVGICDDEPLVREICERIQVKEGVTFSFAEFENGNEGLSFGKKIDLLILDIEMPGLNVFFVRDSLQARKENTIIIFVTDHDKWMENCFRKSKNNYKSYTILM